MCDVFSIVLPPVCCRETGACISVGSEAIKVAKSGSVQILGF